MKKIIIDTDLCFDCDDALAIAMGNIAHSRRLVELLAVTHCLSDGDCADAIALINKYYQNAQIPIGVSNHCHIDCEEGKSYFVHSLQDLQGNREKREYPSSAELILEKLSEYKDCTLVFIGQLNTLAYLIEHKEEFYKGRQIQDLLKTSIKDIVVMGGNFRDSDAEFNIIQDLAAAKTVVKQWDLPLVFVDFHQGKDVYTGEEVQKEADNPVAKIYQAFSKLSGERLRPSWDPIAVYYAIFGGEEFYHVSAAGRAEILPNGQTVFHAGEGRHRLLIVDDKVGMARAIERLFKTIH